jgi:hypothetical protein
MRMLHPERTVRLVELLGDLKKPERLGLLRAPWLDAGRFTARINSCAVFLDGVAHSDGVHGWDGLPLVFLQSGSDAEDAYRHVRTLAEDTSGFASERFGHLPANVRYLHTHANFSDRMRGTLKRQSLVIDALAQFATGVPSIVYDGGHRPFPTKHRILGYRLTDFPALLGVSATVATDYFARIVVHDLCHYYLPRTPFRLEGFHNVAALAAMGELPEIMHQDAWARLVHAECTDPSFCLRAGRMIAEARAEIGRLSPVQEDFVGALRNWYCYPMAAEKRFHAWGLLPGPTEADAAAQLREVIERARRDGFRIFTRSE